MNVVLTYCWKEWRSQRAVLLTFTAMGLAALCLGFLMVPAHFWLEDGRRALVLSWFVVIGVIGVVAFVAPALVRSEFGSKDDQFVRRLPGALLPSFGGKLLFFVLAAAALPLVSLLAGEGFLLAIGQKWHDLFAWTHGGDVHFEWPWPAPMLGAAMLLATWVWAIGTWLPGGRLALGGMILFVLVCSLCVVAMLRQSPKIENGLDWFAWLWVVPVLGAAVAGVSWGIGRRGGGPWRSARFGFAAVAVGFAAPGAWFAQRAWDYHHPDLGRLVNFGVRGMTPDGCYALAYGAMHADFNTVPIRIDLRDGSVEQLGGIWHYASADLQCPTEMHSSLVGLHRYWRFDDGAAWAQGGDARLVFDLATGARTRYGWDEQRMTPIVPADLARAVASENRERSSLRAPDDVRVWFDGDDLVFASPDGREERVRWTGELPRTVRPFGHGLQAWARGGQSVLFDLTRRAIVKLPRWGWGWFVRGRALYHRTSDSAWYLVDGDGAEHSVEALRGCQVQGLADDDHLLCSCGPKGKPPRLLLLRVADLTTVDVPLPADLPPGTCTLGAFGPLYEQGSLLPRDPAGRIWLIANNGKTAVCLRLDPTTRAVDAALPHDASSAMWELLAWPDANTALVRENATIQRVDVATGVRTQLFPRR